MDESTKWAIASAYRRGESIRAIVRMFDVPYSALYSILDEHGVERRRKRSSGQWLQRAEYTLAYMPGGVSSRDAQILRRYLEVRDLARVGREFGLSRERIRQIIAALWRRSLGRGKTNSDTRFGIAWSPSRRDTYHAYPRSTQGAASFCGHQRLYRPRGVFSGTELSSGQLARRCGICLRVLATVGAEEESA